MGRGVLEIRREITDGDPPAGDLAKQRRRAVATGETVHRVVRRGRGGREGENRKEREKKKDITGGNL